VSSPGCDFALAPADAFQVSDLHSLTQQAAVLSASGLNNVVFSGWMSARWRAFVLHQFNVSSTVA
jgi:hypothetical protein